MKYTENRCNTTPKSSVSTSRTQISPHKGEKEASDYRKTSLIREVANENRWLDKPPDEDQIEEMREILRDGDARPPLTWVELITEIEDMLDD